MPSSKNQVVVACAGSGKTTSLVEGAIQVTAKRVLITTYTLENTAIIKQFLIDKCGCIPANITVMSWFSFLLQDCVRPYQNHLVAKRVQSIFFQEARTKFQKQADYLTKASNIYSHKVSQFAVDCNKNNGGLVIGRLEKIYDYVFVDELQDLAAYDLNLLEELFSSNIAINLVADPRQGTFSTNNSLKNKQYRKSNIYSWLKGKEKKGIITIVENSDCWRCNQKICDLADGLFPEYPKTTSLNKDTTGHDGIFFVPPKDVENYFKKYSPSVLRYSKTAKTMNLPATNFGGSKGKTYDRVLIYPTKPMLEYLKTKDLSKAGDKSKFYVAITRAKHSVAFVVDKPESFTYDVPTLFTQ